MPDLDTETLGTEGAIHGRGVRRAGHWFPGAAAKGNP